MLMGITLKASPTNEQRSILSQWMGCARFIWNAKCEENNYLSKFAMRYLPTGTYPDIDQTYSQYKNPELSPWLSKCPSQILRNSAANWYNTFCNFKKGVCGKPKRKKKSDTASIHLTRELFRFEKCQDGVTRLFIGTKTNNIGYLVIKNHTTYKEPKSIRIKRKNGKYLVSFCYDDFLEEENLATQQQHLEHLKLASYEELDKMAIGIDRGIKRPVQAGHEVFDFSKEQKRKKKALDKYTRRCQRSLARQKKGSNRWRRKKQKIARASEKIANIRKDFCHKTSRAIVDNKNNKVIVLEDLRVNHMTKKPKAIKDESGKWKKNQRKAKAGLNRSILDIGWGQFEIFIKYKAYRAGIAVFKVSAHFTSQECANCSHTHPDNRKTQEMFHCACCGHSDNADHNAAEVIKKKAINLILNSGTELSNRGVLLDIGRGAAHKTCEAKVTRARSKEAPKKKDRATKVV